jgi:uncharacterized protein YeaO (DUF488 family)
MNFTIKRAYDPPQSSDGKRILVDRLWPRGLTKEKLKLDRWMKDIAPSNELRKWIHADPSKWSAFETRYFKELDAQPGLVAELRTLARGGTVTLVYAGRDALQNNAVALKKYLEAK